MKRTVLFLLAVSSVLPVFADSMDKQQPNDKCDMQPPMEMHMEGMPSKHHDPNEMRPDKKPMDITQDQAKVKFKDFMDKYMKGYELKDINSVYMPFGALHQATVTDKAGNKFYLDITPEGDVRGPITPRS